MDNSLIPRGLIVSCQGPDDTPLDNPVVMGAMAWAAEVAGAVAVRVEGLPDLEYVRSVVGVPIIGLIKRHIESSEIYITPTLEDAVAVAIAGAHVVAVDATNRPRPDGLTPAEFVRLVCRETGLPVLADIATAAEGLAAAEAGADYISTTLSGYTAQSPRLPGPDLELVRALAGRLTVPLIAEGRYSTPAEAATALRLGAHAVVVGTAITNALEIARRYAEEVNSVL